jgi:hypothetical protein
MKIITNLSVLFTAFSMVILIGSCKKQEAELRATKIGGCLDPNSLNYNVTVDFDDESCQYAFVEQYEITYHPQQDCGSAWDGFPTFGNAQKADLILKIRVKGETTWLYESPEKTDQTHNVPAVWTAPVNIKLLNKTYEWILEDYDTLNDNDLVAQGEFNPMELASNGKVIAIGKNGCNNETQLVLHYVVQ